MYIVIFHEYYEADPQESYMLEREVIERFDTLEEARAFADNVYGTIYHNVPHEHKD